ncbi:MAG: hypothetical protein K0M56_06585 [Kaistella sp.]|nr:hypothetical protein [Kaistella sp.]
MKNYLKEMLLFFTFFTFFSCLHPTGNIVQVKNASYEAYSTAGEKGYKVYFELPENRQIPKAVIINNIYRKIIRNEGKENRYLLNVIAESATIAGFRAERSELENGIIFVKEGKDHFQPVDFKLKKNLSSE